MEVSTPERTRKIAVNRCHGGFGLSDAAIHAYAARKGLTLYPEPVKGFSGPVTYWTVPLEARPAGLEGQAWRLASIEERAAANRAYEEAHIYDRDIPRDDPDLIAVIEQMGAGASGLFAKLEVVEIPADVQWEIDEYDGREWIAEVHRTW